MNDTEIIDAIIEHQLIIGPFHPESEWSGEPDTTATLWDVTTQSRQEDCAESLSWMKDDFREAVEEAVDLLEHI